VLTAFLDESGTDNKSECLAVAGFYGNSGQWKIFRDLWQPSSKAFHALNSDSLFPTLCEVIEASEIHGDFVTIWKAQYEALATEHMKSFIGNTYAVCAFLCAMQICEEVGNAPTSFVYEQGQPNLEFVKRVLDAMRISGDYGVASVTGAKKEDFIELHAADFVSHCASTHETLPLQRLLGRSLLKHGHITEQMLRDVGPSVTKLVKSVKNDRLKAKRLNRLSEDTSAKK
jgi:hypothetical protein